MDRDEERAIEWDCTKVLNQFYVYADAGAYEAAANLYTEDGFWTLGDTELHGREAICDSLRAGMSPVFVKHFIQNIIVDVVDEDHADAVAYSAIYRHETADIANGAVPFVGPRHIGRRDYKMVRTSEGWKVARKDIQRFLHRAD